MGVNAVLTEVKILAKRSQIFNDSSSRNPKSSYPRKDAKVLIIDKGLGLIDGLSIVREFRQGDRHKDTKIITCSANMSDKEIEAVYRMGVFEHISKPFQVPVLVRQVKRALGH